MPGKITMENVDRTFGSVPIDEENQKRIEAIVSGFTVLAREVIAQVPDCAHRSAALRAILEAKWACVDAIAKGGEV